MCASAPAEPPGQGHGEGRATAATKPPQKRPKPQGAAGMDGSSGTGTTFCAFSPPLTSKKKCRKTEGFFGSVIRHKEL